MTMNCDWKSNRPKALATALAAVAILGAPLLVDETAFAGSAKQVVAERVKPGHIQTYLSDHSIVAQREASAALAEPASDSTSTAARAQHR